MGAKVLLAKDLKTIDKRARIIAPIKHAAGAESATGEAHQRWLLYMALCALPVVALLALALVSGGYAAQAAPGAAAGTPTAGAATPTAASAAATSASPAVTTTQAAGTPTVRPTPSGPPPDPENVLTFFSSPSGGTLVKRDYMQLDKDDQE